MRSNYSNEQCDQIIPTSNAIELSVKVNSHAKSTRHMMMPNNLVVFTGFEFKISPNKIEAASLEYTIVCIIFWRDLNYCLMKRKENEYYSLEVGR